MTSLSHKISLFYFPHRYPIDWKTPIGYIAVITYQCIVGSLSANMACDGTLLPIFHCIFMIAFGSDLKNEVHMLNEMVKIKNDKKKKFSPNAIIEIKEKLSEIIRFHGVVKQLSENHSII